jgi:hypothetical protein
MGLNDMFAPTLGMSKNPALAAENRPPAMKGIATDTTIHKLLPSFLVPDLSAFALPGRLQAFGQSLRFFRYRLCGAINDFWAFQILLQP